MVATKTRNRLARYVRFILTGRDPRSGHPHILKDRDVQEANILATKLQRKLADDIADPTSLREHTKSLLGDEDSEAVWQQPLRRKRRRRNGDRLSEATLMVRGDASAQPQLSAATAG